MTKPEEQGGGRQILYREPGKEAEPGQGREAGDFLCRWEEVARVGVCSGSGHGSAGLVPCKSHS